MKSSNNLVIVESPSKAKTIEGYLGKGYKVLASFGHVRDLPKHDLGIALDDNFKPNYIIPAKSRKTVALLKSALENSAAVYLATDYDREGEAIAWHILEACGLNKIKKPPSVHRITFHEITQTALENAMKRPREIDKNLVDAQQSRRVLDRLVGYNLSPFLWKKVLKGLSAGRVQSVAVRLIVDREREIAAFVAVEYFSIEAMFKVKNQPIEASLSEYNGKPVEKLSLTDKKTADDLVKKLKDSQYKIASIAKTEKNKHPLAPFTTSTLQQSANYQLYFSSKQTMKLAQDLYEAGLITYMRTDSVSIASSAKESARGFIQKQYGTKYLAPADRKYQTKTKGAQEAHEAIRPVYPQTPSAKIKGKWSENHLKLYDLVWRRTLASQMSEAKIDAVSIKIGATDAPAVFTASGQKIKFDGFLRVYQMAIREKELPEMDENDPAWLVNLQSDSHFTQPPARYTEASLVKELEENGIGRPSTYAPTISTIIERGYVKVESRVLYPQEIGIIVADLLKKHFPDIVDIDFTAELEEDLDKIARGKKKWTDPLKHFWEPFSLRLKAKTAEVEKQKLVKEIGEKCPQCGKELVERLGRFGRFIACSGFPDCRYSRQIVVDTKLSCPECQKGTLIERRTRKKNKIFWGCSSYPKCKYATWDNPQKNSEPIAKVHQERNRDDFRRKTKTRKEPSSKGGR